MEDQDRIRKLFEGKTIFMSGGTGFLGKVLIEKLIRCCNVKKIYILIRRKKGMSVTERLAFIFKNPLFDLLKSTQPDFASKCECVPGDVTLKELAMSEFYTNKVINEADFIFNMAATTRFDDTITYAVSMNTRGTEYMLHLAKQCKKLKLFIHCSTAYAFPHETVLEEKRYAPPVNPHDVLDSLKWIKEDPTGRLTQELLGDSPNTYTFSKALAEELVNEQVGKMPVIIVRPAIVIPIFDSPLKGWCNNLQGPMGLFVGAGKGVIRSMYMNPNSYANFIPADSAINIMLFGSLAYLSGNNNKQYIYNAVSPREDFHKTWEEIINEGRKVIEEDIPFNMILWYPGGTMTQNKLLHTIYFYLFQMIPAIFVDMLLFILGYPPVLYKVQRRIQNAGAMFEFYTTQNWDFKDSAAILRSGMSELEKKRYKMDPEGFSVRTYLRDCMLCVRRVNLKESDDMLPRAKRTMRIMYVVDKLCKTWFFLGMFYYIYKLAILPMYME
ncbi:unnamed protein product [Brassicogethes aeneus]|uniref:Fatty acyl-CoA reductase n=1 Tax=Brassicogethes aeneus TaxID=1431903 RepID=A0A9P0FB78_BRAAE|nr:unnamed protein product [Brassicogethes aeneus]